VLWKLRDFATHRAVPYIGATYDLADAV